MIVARNGILPRLAGVPGSVEILPIICHAVPVLRSVAAIALPGVEVFELGVACEVFGQDRRADGVPLVDFALVTEHPGPVPTAAGFSVEVGRGLQAAEQADLVVVLPGCDRHAPAPAAVLQLLRDTVARGARLLSICSGAFVLAQAGLLDGRRCTTHWLYADELARDYPHAVVDPAVLYVDDGPVVTSAGSAAGIDAALHVLRQEFGAVAAAAVARRMVVPPHRDGGQAQYLLAPVPACADDDLAAVLEWAGGHLDADLGVDALARRARMSARTFARRFTAATGTSPGAWVARQRLDRARELLEGTDLSVDVVAQRVGWGSAAVLRHHFGALGTTPLAYRRTFAGRPASAAVR
jgi:transcriptional regulator GlxA family with amidase domain